MDPVSDMLTSIRNALAVEKTTVDIPFSNFKYEIAKIFEKEGFIEKIEKKGRKSKKVIEINLKYIPADSVPTDETSLSEKTDPIKKDSADKIPAISGLKKISKPGQRIYSDWKKIKKVKGGYGTAIISTSKGLMTNKEARKNKLGGEIICEIW